MLNQPCVLPEMCITNGITTGKNCSGLPEIAHGLYDGINCTDLTYPPVYEDVCIFKCDLYYKIESGTKNITYTCLGNETWSAKDDDTIHMDVDNIICKGIQ